jgi:hypothetical protein
LKLSMASESDDKPVGAALEILSGRMWLWSAAIRRKNDCCWAQAGAVRVRLQRDELDD